jgi:PAS domain S-box-containing protein
VIVEMPVKKRFKTKYPGVYYIEGKVSGSKKKERIYYIIYRKDGKQFEERAGRQFRDNMAPSRAARIRTDCINGDPLSQKGKKRKNIKAEIESNALIVFASDDSETMKAIQNPRERYHSDEVQWEKETGYLTLQDLSPDPVLLFQDGLPKMASTSFYKVFGYSKEDIGGLTTLDLVHERHKGKVQVQVDASLLGKEIPTDNLTDLITKDGKIIPCETFKCVVPYNGRPGYLVILRDISERKRAEQTLKERELELDIKNERLEEMNAALRVLLLKRDEDKNELEEKVLLNIQELVMPYLEKVKNSSLDARQQSFLSILESNLDGIVSPFLRRMSSSQLKLTPSEIQISNFVKQGKTSKEIASLLSLSDKTIESHRRNIRKKIGIKNKKENLRTHLLDLFSD